MHLKRQKTPKEWPIPRKGTKYVVKPKFSLKKGIPALIVLRDILGIAENRKQVKIAIHKKEILLNSKPLKDEKNSILLFDVLKIVPSNEIYRMTINKNRKISFIEEQEKDSKKKISKIINKKILKGKKIQLNFSDGKNILSDIKCNTNDSVIINLEENKIEKCLPLEEKSKVFIFAGKHSGKEGIIKKLDKEKGFLELDIDKKIVNVLIKQIIVIK